MRILIAVPSKNRATLYKVSTFKILNGSGLNYKCFVEPQDQSDYYYEDNLIVLPENNKGLGYAKVQIQKYAIDNGYDYIFKMDDDCIALAMANEKLRGTAGTYNSTERLIRLLDSCTKKILEDSAIGLITFPYRNELYPNLPAWQTNARAQSNYIVKSNLMFFEADRFEDFATYIHVRLSGEKVLRFNKFGFSMRKMGYTEGGFQSFQIKSIVQKTTDELKQNFPWIKFRAVKEDWGLEPDIRYINKYLKEHTKYEQK